VEKIQKRNRGISLTCIEAVCNCCRSGAGSFGECGRQIATCLIPLLFERLWRHRVEPLSHFVVHCVTEIPNTTNHRVPVEIGARLNSVLPEAPGSEEDGRARGKRRWSDRWGRRRRVRDSSLVCGGARKILFKIYGRTDMTLQPGGWGNKNKIRIEATRTETDTIRNT
jgi:hypothetical protein